MKKKIVLSAIVLTGLIIAISGWYYFSNRGSEKPLSESRAVPVTVVSVKKIAVPEQITAVGTLLANQSVTISPEVAGHVAEILFHSGSYVTKGTPLIKLDSAIQAAKLRGSEATLALAQTNYQRMLQLLRHKVISQSEFDNVHQALESKQAQTTEDRVTLQKMTLTAPFNGILGKQQVNVGDYLGIGQGILKIVDIDKLRVTYQVPEKYLSKLRVGQAINLTTDAFSTQNFSGIVSFVAPDIDPTAHAVELQAEIPNLEHHLLPGVFAKVTQVLGVDDQALVIPEQCLVPTIEGFMVYRVADNKAVAAPVRIGTHLNGNVQIINGLNSGDIVLASGQQRVKDGGLVNVRSIHP